MFVSIVRIAVVVAFAVSSQAALAESRTDDLVQVKDDKFTINEYSLCTVKRPQGAGIAPKFQLLTYSEAPDSDVISRDNFVAYTVSTLTYLRAAFTQRWGLPLSEAFSALECETLAKPIGTVDIEIKMFMTAEGVQVEFTDNSTGKVSRTTDAWQDQLPPNKGLQLTAYRSLSLTPYGIINPATGQNSQPSNGGS